MNSGYGYPSFSSLGGRAFAVLWILIGTIFVAQFILCLAELNAEKRQKHLVECVLTRRMTNFDIEAADIDDDGVVDAADFALYKLKEMGKITQEDVNLVMAEFKELHVDQSGTLSCLYKYCRILALLGLRPEDMAILSSAAFPSKSSNPFLFMTSCYF